MKNNDLSTKSDNKIYILIFLSFFLLSLSNYSYAENNGDKNKLDKSSNAIYAENEEISQQKKTITGKIIDTQGLPIIGANIIEVGTASNGTVTNEDGDFSLSVGENAVLHISYIGYLEQDVPTTGRTTFNITLLEDTKTLEELVVVGYGTQKKETLTGSIVSTGGETIKRSPSDVTNSLSGLLPGLVTLNRSGEPGANTAALFIRGQNTTGSTSPLVVVDGVQSPSGWQRIDPKDIDQISILKDASAAVYGSRAANGVILITTKRGAIGKPVVNYNFNLGINQPTRTPELAPSYLFAENVNQLLQQSNQDPRYTQEEIELFKKGTDPNYPNTDWYGEVLKDFSLQQRHNLNLRGGTNDIKYLISGSFSNQNSIFKNGMHKFNGYTLRSNIDAKVTENISTQIDINGNLGDRVSPGSEDPWGWLLAIPMMPVYYPNGLPSAGIEQGLNPAVMVTEAGGRRDIKDKNFQAKISFDIKIPWVSGLSINSYYVYNTSQTLDKNWRTPWTVYNYDVTTDEYLPLRGGRITAPQLTQSSSTGEGNFVHARLIYEKQFDRHYINTFVGAEQSKGKDVFFDASRRDYMTTVLPELFAGEPKTQENNGYSSEYGRQSVIGRLSYNLDEKYLLDFNARYDGTHVFPKGKRFGFFPGVSVAWRMNKEPFLMSAESIDELKLRASIGQIGNDAISPYQFLASYRLNLDRGYTFGMPGNASLGAAQNVVPNPNITWEVATIMNAGFDASLWNRALDFSFDVFKQERNNILTTRDLAVPAYTALVLPQENIGTVENKGIEVALTHRKTLSVADNFSFIVGGNFAYAKNKIIDMSEASNVPDYQKAEGKSLGAELLYEAIGIFRTQEQVDKSPVYPGTQVGDLQYRDVNKDGVISALDRVRMNNKSNIPQITFGFNFTVTYKRFSLFSNFSGQGNAWQYYHQNTRVAINTLKELLENRWTPGSMDSKYPKLPTVETQTEPSGLRSTFWLQNAAFLRLKTLELGYDVPQNFVNKIKLSSVRVYLNGNNLFTISDIKWFDPEGNNERGNFYPQNKIFNLGVDLSF